MEVFHDLQGRIMYDLQGRIMAKNPIPSIDLEHERQFFPPQWITTTAGNTRFTSQGENEIFIDFGDGSPIYTEVFSGSLIFSTTSPIHEYDTIERRTVRIWFKYPERINAISFSFQNYIGNFPLNLGLYSLDSLSFNGTRFDEFPINFLGGVFNTLSINRLTEQTIYSIPKWITTSRIRELSLHRGIELDNDVTDSIEDLMNIQGLEILSLAGNKITDIPSNFKDKDTLKNLQLGDNPFTEITQNVNDCKQLTELSFGFSGYWTGVGSNLFTSWGIGIANMPNLQVFRFDNCNNAPDTLPTGIETAPNCKTIWARTNRTQIRQDTFIENVYNQVVATASMATGQGILRRTTLRTERFSVNPYLRPSGIYQAPTGYAQGISNGTPASAMEMIYVLVNQYEWTIYVTSEGPSGHDIYAP